MIAVVVVRDGVLPLGGLEAVAEAGGRVLLAGPGALAAAAEVGGHGRDVRSWDSGAYAPAAYAAALAPLLTDEDVVVLPASPDGRDLAPRLALELHRPLYGPAISVRPGRVVLVRGGGLLTEEIATDGPVVSTLQPGVRGVEPGKPAQTPVVQPITVVAPVAADPVVTGQLEADPDTVDLADASRIVAAGAGVGSREDAELLAQVATALGASYGATRVVTDAGWAPVSRQIGTTGVVVAPDLYVAVGISGAVQHVSGIGEPRTVVAVNLDASCPMMARADLALVTDATGLVHALAERLGLAVAEPAAAGGGWP